MVHMDDMRKTYGGYIQKPCHEINFLTFSCVDKENKTKHFTPVRKKNRLSNGCCGRLHSISRPDCGILWQSQAALGLKSNKNIAWMANVNNNFNEIVEKFSHLGLKCSGRNSRCFDNLTPGVQAALWRRSDPPPTNRCLSDTPQIWFLKALTSARESSVTCLQLWLLNLSLLFSLSLSSLSKT